MVGSGSGLAYGKMAYRRMTYDLVVSDKYTDRHNQGSDRMQIFRFPEADGSIKEIARENIMDIQYDFFRCHKKTSFKLIRIRNFYT